MPSDVAFGRAAPAPGVRTSSPELPKLLERVLELEKERGRSHAVSFAGSRTVIRLFQTCEQAVDGTVRSVKPLFVLELPAVIRGRVTLTYEEYLALEIEAPVESQDVSEKVYIRR